MMSTMVIDEATRSQIAGLRLDPDRPLLLCDVDEVVVHFLRGLENWLDRNGLWLDPASFALNGNIRRKADNEPLPADEIGPALMAFFEAETANLEVIDGAVEALGSLSAEADIVMLTNLPSRFRDARTVNLRRHGIEFPVVTNSGPKGPAIAALAGLHSAPVVFIDDNNGYLKSAADHVPHTYLVHFMQDERFGRHVPLEDHIHHRTDNWQDAHLHIGSVFAGPRTR
jgi:hypothetical protein